MFSPSNRLIFFSILLAPVLALSGLGRTGLLLAASVYALFLILALLDYYTASNRNATFTVSAPETVRVQKNSSTEFTVAVHLSGKAKLSHITVGLAIPFELGPNNEVQQIARTDETFVSTWSIHPQRRGAFAIDHTYLRWLSPMGLWEIKKKLPITTTVRVFPDLRRDRRFLANLFMNRGLVGLKQQRVTGQGRDYDQIRDYEPGDSQMDIHWKASAKRNSLVTKTFQIERTQEIYVAIDHSRLSQRTVSTQDERLPEVLLERFINAANILGIAANRGGDLFGLLTFANNTDRFIRAGSGTHHLQAMQSALYNLHSKDVYPDFDEWARFVRMNVRRRSLIVLMTDLSDMTAFESLERRIKMLAKTHLVVIAMIPMDGVQPVFSEAQTDPYSALAGHTMWKDLQLCRKRLHAHGVQMLLASSENLALDVVNSYLQVKQRQSL